MAADRRWAWPRLGVGADGRVGSRFGEAKPLSDLVGLVLMTVMASPERMWPPTNSLPPRRWPTPDGLAGMARGDCGDWGGLRKALSGAGARLAPGLKEKSGRAGDLGGPLPSSSEWPEALSSDSVADLGRRPVARE